MRDAAPHSLFAALLRKHPYAFWLDSGMQRGGEGRYSAVGVPCAVFLADKNGWRLRTPEGKILRRGAGNPWDAMRKIYEEERRRWRGPKGAAHLPFAGGFAGCWGYGLKRWLEKYPGGKRRDRAYAGMPEAALLLARDLIVWDHRTKRRHVLGSWKQGFPPAAALPEFERGPTALKAAWSEAAYRRALRKIQKHIAAGDIYQANLTYRMEFALPGHPLALYLRMRQANPAPYAAYFALGGWHAASTSPERLLRVRGRHALSEPMKGTARRGKNSVEDRRLKRELQASEKNRAENLMICDLVRNDLGRVCEPGSLRVSRLFHVDTYRTLHQMISRVEGRLRRGVSALDALKALFPPGSMTGAPKIRAVQILDGLESSERGFYSGAIGYWDFRGNAEWSVAIRTLTAEGGRAFYHTGGGIVADSRAKEEWRESRLKAEVLRRALG